MLCSIIKCNLIKIISAELHTLIDITKYRLREEKLPTKLISGSKTSCFGIQIVQKPKNFLDQTCKNAASVSSN